MKPFISRRPVLPWLLIICGTIGLLCAGVIMHEKVALLTDPTHKIPCNLDPIISCGSVMQSDQANAFGFPNPFIGLAAFPVLITTGVVMLAGAKLKRWYMLSLTIGACLGTVFVHWLFIQSVWHIGALCPWCMAVWIVTITTFVHLVAYTLHQGFLRLPARLSGLSRFVQKHPGDITLVWILLIAGLILHHFWYFYGEKLGF